MDKNTAEAVQAFREAQNLLPTLYTHIAALTNITTQKTTLSGAARRRARCFAAPQCTPHLLGAEDDDTDAHEPLTTAPTSLGCEYATSPVLTSPLGVLAAFAPSTVHHLVAQHQRDEEELLGVISRITQQSWPQKVAQLKSKIARFEQGDEAAVTSRSTSASRGMAAPSPTATSSSYFATTAELAVALYGLAACLHKMESVLQETTLALRRDAGASLMTHIPANAASTGAVTSADAATRLAAVFAREGGSADGPALLSMCTFVSEGETLSVTPAPLPPSTAEAAIAVTASAPPPRLVEAVGQLESFLEESWERLCDTYLTPESQLLLALV